MNITPNGIKNEPNEPNELNDTIVYIREIEIQPNLESIQGTQEGTQEETLKHTKEETEMNKTEMNECIICYDKMNKNLHLKHRVCNCKCEVCETCSLKIIIENKGYYKCPICNYCIQNSIDQIHSNSNTNTNTNLQTNAFSLVDTFKYELIGCVIVILLIPLFGSLFYYIILK